MDTAVLQRTVVVAVAIVDLFHFLHVFSSGMVCASMGRFVLFWHFLAVRQRHDPKERSTIDRVGGSLPSGSIAAVTVDATAAAAY